MTRDRRAIDAAAEALSGILERERRTGTLDPSPELDALEGEQRAALQEMGWIVISIVGEDVGHYPQDLIERVQSGLARSYAA